MPGTPARKSKPRSFRVLISFNGLNKGEVFQQEADDLGWALQHVQAGYLEEVADAGDDQEG